MSTITNTPEHPTDGPAVLVVGAGPAGLTAAITLARNGVDVLLVERHAGTSPFPKATGVSTRTMELLRGWGLEQRAAAAGMTVQPTFAISHTLLSPAQTTVPFGYPTEEQARAVSPVVPACIPQDHLEPVLRDHLVEQGGTIRFATELTNLAVGPTGVDAELTDRKSGRRYHVHPRYVVGADGPWSGVRSAMGIQVADLGTLGEFLAVTFRADLTRQMSRRPSAINAVQVTGAEGLFVPTSADDRWIYARELRAEPGERLGDWTPERIGDVLRVGSGLPDLDPQILTVMPFVMGGHLATTFSAGPVFLVGDAAHRTTPVGGTGMNTAMQGAHNLGWKLAWVLRGWADESLLDSYELERRPIGEANVRRSLQRGPNGEADGLAWDIGVQYSSPVFGSGVGVGGRAPHLWVRRPSGGASTLDLFGDHLTVLTGPHGAPWRRAADELASEGLPITTLTLGRDLSDELAHPGALARRYGLGASGAVLIRPDGYVVWHRPSLTGESGASLRDAVDVALSRPDRARGARPSRQRRQAA